MKPARYLYHVAAAVSPAPAPSPSPSEQAPPESALSSSSSAADAAAAAAAAAAGLPAATDRVRMIHHYRGDTVAVAAGRSHALLALS
jgi:hypothetical protein